jgi:hypothetical protein
VFWFAYVEVSDIFVIMKSVAAPPAFKVSDPVGRNERGYASWKREKVERGLAQSKERSAMVPADEVWRELGLEG